MNPPGVRQPPEQQRYARVLDWSARIGLVVLVTSFAAYLTGLLESHVPPQRLPQLWIHPVDRFVELTGSPRGWNWIAMIHLGDMAGLLGMALLAGGSLACLLAVLPLYAARRDRAFVWVCVAQIAVIVVAASGWFAGVH